jgi:hypothetical protein
MKEQAQASIICRYLDQGAEQLPYRVVERLAAARARALAQVAEPAPVAAAFPAPLPSADGAVGPIGGFDAAGAGIQIPTPHAPATWRPPVTARDSKPAREPRTPFWWRFAATVVPLLMLAVGVLVVDTVHQEQSAAELAEVDSALLTDDVPLVAYADRGFGVYIKNTRR